MPGASARVRGIDVARLAALVGMMAVHLLRGVDDGAVTLTHQVAAGRSSALFAVLAGVGIVLVSGTREPLRGRAWRAEQAGAWGRALALAALGLVLGTPERGLAVILTYYAVLFVLATPFLALGTRWLAAAAVAATVLGPPLSQALRRSRAPGLPGDPSLAALADPVALLQDLLLTGNYPAVTWLPYVLAGMVLARLDLRSAAVASGVVVAGLAATAVAWIASDTLVGLAGVRASLVDSLEGRAAGNGLDLTLARGLDGVVPTDSWHWLLVRAPHSGAWFDLLGTLGSAYLVIGVCLLAGRHLPPRWAPLAGAGTMTLSLYSAHVALRTDGLWDATGWVHLTAQVALVVVVGAGFALADRRGPLEVLVSRASRAARRAVPAPVSSTDVRELTPRR